MSYFEQINFDRMPHHIAIIMDGNGRWATKKGRLRTFGHIAGIRSLREIMEAAIKLGIKYLTLYAFSTENWSRPQPEVAALMKLMIKNAKEELFMKNNARFRIIGDIDRLPEDVVESLRYLETVTAGNTGTCMVLAVSYSSRNELERAVKGIARDVENGVIKAEDVDEKLISSRLDTAFMPDPDLLIRTGGETRLSNYLLWQSAYTELYFTDVLWPDFNEENLCQAICNFQGRQRRFGKTEAQVENEQGHA